MPFHHHIPHTFRTIFYEMSCGMMHLNLLTKHYLLSDFPRYKWRHLHHSEKIPYQKIPSSSSSFSPPWNPFGYGQTDHNSSTSPWNSSQETLISPSIWIWTSYPFVCLFPLISLKEQEPPWPFQNNSSVPLLKEMKQPHLPFWSSHHQMVPSIRKGTQHKHTMILILNL